MAKPDYSPLPPCTPPPKLLDHVAGPAAGVHQADRDFLGPLDKTIHPLSRKALPPGDGQSRGRGVSDQRGGGAPHGGGHSAGVARCRVGKAQRAHADNTTSDATNGGHGHAAFAHPTARSAGSAANLECSGKFVRQQRFVSLSRHQEL
jgi:hypothetical protein